jgi:hypothetical protein
MFTVMLKFPLGLENQRFRFGVIGVYNTKPDNSFYKVTAHVGGGSYVFIDPDWEKAT